MVTGKPVPMPIATPLLRACDSSNVNAVAMTQPAVVAFPGNLTLPAGPFKAEYPSAVTVRNNSRAGITWSNAVVNVPGVKTVIQESDPGHMMNVSLTFPVGFQLKSGQTAELSVNTSHPKFPLLRVPITQAEPAPATVQPGSASGAGK